LLLFFSLTEEKADINVLNSRTI